MSSVHCVVGGVGGVETEMSCKIPGKTVFLVTADHESKPVRKLVAYLAYAGSRSSI